MVGLGAAAGLVAGSVCAPGTVSSGVTNLFSAEQVAARFVVAFESYGPGSAASASVAGLATGQLASMLASRPGSGSADALQAEGYRVRATVEGFTVSADSRSSVDLLMETELTVAQSSGSSSYSLDVPVTLARTRHGWKVSEAGGIGAPAAAAAAVSPSGGKGSAGHVSSSPVSPPPAATHTVSAPTTPDPVGPVGDIPAQYVALFESGARAECPAMSWTVLAGIGKVESDFGQSTLPGVHSGANSAGAEGPMQFEPDTFARYAVVAPGGADPASPYDPADAVYSAAHLLCANGAGHPATLYDAIFDYNHSASYVQLVLAYAAAYATDAGDGGLAATLTSTTLPNGTARDAALASVVIADAQVYLGTPYVWGGENPKVGFDCSGLVQWVFAEAGVHLPRVAQEQYDYGPILAKGASLDPGDLVFFGGGPSDVEHVGIYVGDGEMIDAPYTGAVVRYDKVADVPLGFVGATRPEDPNITSVGGLPVVEDDITDVGHITVSAPPSRPRHPTGTSTTVPWGSVGATRMVPVRGDGPARHRTDSWVTTTTTTTATTPAVSEPPHQRSRGPGAGSRLWSPPGSTTTRDPSATTTSTTTSTTSPAPTTTTSPAPTTTTVAPQAQAPMNVASQTATHPSGGHASGAPSSPARKPGASGSPSTSAPTRRGTGSFSRSTGGAGMGGGRPSSGEESSGRPGPAPAAW